MPYFMVTDSEGNKVQYPNATSGHSRLSCSNCEKVIAQCRCMQCDKNQYYTLCDDCKKLLEEDTLHNQRILE